MTSKQSNKKTNKKVIPNLQFSCKFRGKYDLRKNKVNKELDLKNAINLFDVIYKKNETLYKECNIKMFSNKKMFSFSDKGTLKKIHHRVPYVQVLKFFIMQRDLKMVILGVHHKTHKWFLVFQFKNDEEATAFCDEIEGQKKVLAEENAAIENENVPKIIIENDYPDNYECERLSIHSEMLDDKQYAADNLEDSFFCPDLEPELIQETAEDVSQGQYSSRSSSRNSIDDLNEKIHCDDMKQSKLKELYINPEKAIYNDKDNWKETLSCVKYPNEHGEVVETKNGSVYLYCASHKVTIDNMRRSSNSSYSSSSSDDDNEEFVQYKPKLIKSNKDEEYSHYEPKMVYLNH